MKLKYGLIIDGGISRQDVGRVVKIKREQDGLFVLMNGFCTAIAKHAVILISKEQYEFLEYLNLERELKIKLCDYIENNGGDYIRMLRDLGELKTGDNNSERRRIFEGEGQHVVSIPKAKVRKVRKKDNNRHREIISTDTAQP